MSAIRILLICYAIILVTQAAEWSYTGRYGSAQWSKMFPACSGDRQSPINIFEGNVKWDKGIGPFKYRNYGTSRGVGMTLSNNGHTAVVALSGVSQITIEGGGLPAGRFRAASLHFHWGEDVETGSEHLISSRSYPMELHIVHVNTKYTNIGTALTKNDGLAVLGFMFQISEEDNINYSGIVNFLPLIRTPGSVIDIPTVALKTLLPANFSKFYRYAGSLTTPTCQESVTWTVFKEPVYISETQLDGFRILLDSHWVNLVNNFRPVQPLNERSITSNFDPKIYWSYSEGQVNADQWSSYYSDCGGTNQSPINIQTGSTVLDTNLQDFKFHNYSNDDISLKLVNNGRSVDMDLSGEDISISGGGLPEEYKVSRLLFHWGSSDDQGSEHTVNQAAYPMEVHIVHFKKSLGSLFNAIRKPDGLAVLGFFFEVSPNDNRALDSFVRGLWLVRNPGSSTAVSSFSLESILPANKTNYFRYSGSLTAPGCYESVIWSVFTDTIKISPRQLAVFRSLISSEKDEEGETLPMVDNFRPIQNLNGRVVTRNFGGEYLDPHTPEEEEEEP